MCIGIFLIFASLNLKTIKNKKIMAKTLKISYRMEIEITGDTIDEIRNEFESLNLSPDERAEFVEVVHVCDGDTYEDLTSEFENC